MSGSSRLARHIAAKEGKGATSAEVGLQRAMARAEAAAVGDMPVDKLVAGLSANQKDQLKQLMNVTPARAQAPKASPPPAARFTQADIDRAVAKARDEERARIKTVFAAQASHGRERVCSILLTAPQNWSGAYIASELPHLATDKDLEAGRTADANARADAVWDKANAAAAEQRPAKVSTILAHQAAFVGARPKASQQPAKAERAADGVWDRAYADVNAKAAKILANHHAITGKGK